MPENIGLEAVLKMRQFERAASKYNSTIDDMNRQTERGAGGITQTFETMSGSALRVAGILSGALVAGATAAATAIAGIAVSGAKSAMEMEQQVADIAAVMSKTKDEIQPLSDLIVDLGLDPGLKVEADEAAETIELLARNGLTMTEILNGAAKSTVLLANATGTEFGNAANIATDAMAIFNIEAADMESAVDGIVSVTTNSKFTIDDFRLALANGGAVAKSAGVDFDQFNTAVAALAPQFASGSTAGTALKNMLLRLAPSTNTAKDTMNELNLISLDAERTMRLLRDNGIEPTGDSAIELRDGLQELSDSFGENGATIDEIIDNNGLMQNAFFDSEGQMKDMSDIAQILQDTFSDLSEEERNVALNAIFGRDAMGAVVGLMELGADSGEGAANAFESLQETMGDTSAAKSAETRMDTLAGTIEILMGMVDGFKLQIGQALLPILRLLAERLSSLVETVGPKVVDFFGTISTFITDFVNALFEGQGPVDAFFGALEAAGLGSNILVPLRQIVTGVQDFIMAASSFVQEHSEAFIGAIKALGIAFAGLAIAGVVTSLLALINPVTLIIAAVAALGAAWETNWFGIRDKTKAVIKFLQPYIMDALAIIQQFWVDHGQQITTAVFNAFNFIQEKVTAVVGGISEFITATLNALREFWAAHGETIMALITNTFEFIRSTIENVMTVVQSIIAAVQAAIHGDWYEFGVQLRKATDAAWEHIKNAVIFALKNLLTFLADFIPTVQAKFVELWEKAKDAWQDIDWDAVAKSVIDGLVNGLTRQGDRVREKLVGIASAALEAAKGFFGIGSPAKTTIEMGEDVGEGEAVGLEKKIERVRQAAKRMAEAALIPVADTLGGRGEFAPVIPQTVSLDSASLAALASRGGVGGETHYHYHLNTRTTESEGTVTSSFSLLEMLNA